MLGNLALATTFTDLSLTLGRAPQRALSAVPTFVRLSVPQPLQRKFLSACDGNLWSLSNCIYLSATVAAAKRGLEEKRDLPATTKYPASRLSSACSCISTAQPTPTTVYTTTVTTTTTVGAGSCTVPTPIVKNGNFESSLAPWTVATVIPDPVDYAQYISFGVKSPGYKSDNAFTVTDDLASSYFELDLTQDITLCAGKKYNFAAKFYMTDSKNVPTKETYLTFFVDDARLAGSTFADGIGPPIVWKSLTGSFTATGSSATLRAQFVATNFVGETWGIDNVVITPA